MPKRQTGINFINSVMPVLLALLIGAIIMISMGENPFKVYGILVAKSLMSVKGLGNTLHYAAPLILTGLAIAITFKANIFNMGVEGQLLFGAFFGGAVGSLTSIQSPILHKIIVLLVGAVFGMLFALIPALLRAYYHVDEMVVTLTLNYAMIKVLEYLASGPFRYQGAGYVTTPPIQPTAMFSRIGSSRLTLFFGIAILIFVIFWVIMQRSALGYEITAIGRNPKFAEATGMNTRRKIIILMLISGALAGLAGAGYMMSEKYQYTLDFSGNPGLGWDGMLIALLGRHSPVGVLIAAIFYSVLKTGADNINMYTSVPREVISVIQGLMILFLAVQFISQQTGTLSQIKVKIARKMRGEK